MDDWTAEDYDNKAQQHYKHAARLRQEARRAEEEAKGLLAYGNQANQRYMLWMSASVLREKAYRLTRTANDWLEKSMELEDLQ